MSEVHCTAWIHCDPKDFDFVKQTLQDHGMLDETGTTDSSVIFSAMYFNSDDATCVIDDLGDKVYDFEFDFEDYQFGGRWLIVEPIEVDDDGLRLPSADEEEKI